MFYLELYFFKRAGAPQVSRGRESGANARVTASSRQAVLILLSLPPLS